jgi:hypothetical protein
VLVSDRSGVGALLVELLGSKASRDFVVPVSGDVDIDTYRWAEAVNVILRDRESAFRRANELRHLLMKAKTWNASIRDLMTAMRPASMQLDPQVLATRAREQRNWRVHIEELRWRRERGRERERENSRYANRSDAYVEVVGCIEAFDWILHEARRAIKKGSLCVEIKAELRSANRQVRGPFGKFNLYAPEAIRMMLRDVMMPRSALFRSILNGSDDEELWSAAQSGYRMIRAAMRKDLGLDDEDALGLQHPDVPELR